MSTRGSGTFTSATATATVHSKILQTSTSKTATSNTEFIKDFISKPYPSFGAQRKADQTKISPKKVLPYFVELVLTNQVRSKESEDHIAEADAARRAAAILAAEQEQRELEEKLLRESEGEEEEEEYDDHEDHVGAHHGANDEFVEHLKARRGTAESQEEGQEVGHGGDLPAELDADHQPGKLKAVAAHGFYMKKNLGRRGGVWNVANEVTDSTHRRFSRTAWRKAMNNLEPEYRLPALILKKHLYVKKQGPTRLGPGTYDIDYNKLLDVKKNATTRGLMTSCARRFPKEKEADDIPGPGTYGIPHEAVERAADKYKHPGRITLFRSGPCDVRKVMNGGGSNIPPGYYKAKDGVTEMLKKVVSLRGPYDLYTPDRLIIPYGYHKSAKDNPLGPGQYNIRRSLKQEWNLRANRYKGIFSPYQRDRKLTGERIVLVAPLWPVHTEDTPGPGEYDPRPRWENVKKNKYPFSSTANVRIDSTGDYDMAPNRYHTERASSYCPLGCGHKSVFRSKTGRLDPLKIAVMTERLRPKDIPHEERVAWNTR